MICYFLIALGAISVIISVTADLIGIGSSGFGHLQTFGIIVGSLLVIGGILKLYLTSTKDFANIFAPFYICALLFICLVPTYCSVTDQKILLNASTFSLQDFTINIIGYFPLGLLLMLSFARTDKNQRFMYFFPIIIILATASLISFAVEILQYYFIFGRSSSLYDFCANFLGTFGGIVTYLLIARLRLFNSQRA